MLCALLCWFLKDKADNILDLFDRSKPKVTDPANKYFFWSWKLNYAANTWIRADAKPYLILVDKQDGKNCCQR